MRHDYMIDNVPRQCRPVYGRAAAAIVAASGVAAVLGLFAGWW